MHPTQSEQTLGFVFSQDWLMGPGACNSSPTETSNWHGNLPNQPHEHSCKSITQYFCSDPFFLEWSFNLFLISALIIFSGTCLASVMFGNTSYDSYLLFQQAVLKGFSVFIWHLFKFSFNFSDILFFSLFFFQIGFAYFKEMYFLFKQLSFFSSCFTLLGFKKRKQKRTSEILSGRQNAFIAFYYCFYFLFHIFQSYLVPLWKLSITNTNTNTYE